MKKIIKIIPVLLLVTLIGCNDLDEKVFSTLTEDGYTYSEGEALNVIGPVYTNLRSFYGQTRYMGIQILSTDILVMPANASGWFNDGRQIRHHKHTWKTDEMQFPNAWNALYKGVLLSNRIIEQLESGKVPAPSNTSIESLIAEVKVTRAFYYWLLIDSFGDVPFYTSTSSELVNSTDRNTIFESIVSDITTSLDKLNPENNRLMYGRFNKWAAKTLLATLYINSEVYTGTAQWEKVLDECNDIISSGEYSLEQNYADCFSPYNENSVETVFAIPNDEINAGGFNIYRMTLHASSKDKYKAASPWGAAALKAVPQFIDTYDTTDQRLYDTWEMGLQLSYEGDTLRCAYDKAGEPLIYTKELPNGEYTAENEGYRVIKYQVEIGCNGNMNNDFIFFRYAHVLMMKAESLLRMGRADEAADIVTQVRQRAFKNNPEKATVTGTELMSDSKYNWGYVENYDIVEQGDISPIEFGGFYDELGWEFACEWMRRRQMIRFGTYTTKSWLSHKPNGNYRTVFPIPEKALDANPKLEQNPDYQ